MAGHPKHIIATEFGCTALVDDDARHLRGLDQFGLASVDFKYRADESVVAAPGAVLCRTWKQVREVRGL